MIDSSKAIVAITHCDNYTHDAVETAIAKQFDLLGGISTFVSRGDKILIKPNLIAPVERTTPAQTDPEVIFATAKLLKDFGAEPFVADSTAWGTVAECLEKLELDKRLDAIGVKYIDLTNPVKTVIDGTKVGISQTALETDKIINIPKLKAHSQLYATLAIKNMFGCVVGKEKAYWHFARGGDYEKFCRLLIGIYQKLSPTLNIVDGIIAMQGPGPLRGTQKQLGLLAGGIDPVAIERILCEVINFDPADLPILQTAKKLGFGENDRNKIQTIGDDHISLICKDFEPAEQIALRFSFPRICKSIIKQTLLLISKPFRK